MTTSQRTVIPDSIRTNGATPNPWWSNAVVYQIYPRSFQDTNGDGLGDLKGITSRLDYLADLGVDVLWLSPVYKSPQDDNGYDISDYQDIDPLFGTLDDMDELLAEAHKRGLKIVMDLVVNHTSDEHAWFEASKNKDDEHADWYWWRPARPGTTAGEPGAEPNQWGSYFGGSAWEYCPERGEYYLHQFSKKQPDLNWENPAVRRAVYDMMNWWLDRGVDGFRMDVITLISKRTDLSGKLPGEYGSELDDLPVGEEGYSNPNPFCADGPRQDEFLAEMRREVFEGREGFLTVGEAPGVTAQRNEYITDPANGELDMLFLFEHVDFDCEGVKWKPLPLDLPKLKSIMAGYQAAVKNAGWASLFTGNHDQPRVVSRWGDDSSEESRVRSAKALGLMLHMHRGTPYIYQGEELGMTDAHFTRLDQYRDLESLNAYRQRLRKPKCSRPNRCWRVSPRAVVIIRVPRCNGTALSMPVSLRRMPLRSHGSPSIPTMRRSTRPANSTIRIRYMPSTSSSSRCATTCLSWRPATGICSMRMTRMSTPSPAPSAMRSCWSWSTCPAEPLIYRAKPPNWPPPESPSRTW